MTSQIAAEQFVRSIAAFPIVLPRTVEVCLETVEALAEGGARGVEIVLRGSNAMAALGATVREFPHIAFAAGTVLTEEQLDEAVGVGARLTISPGLCQDLVTHAANSGVVHVPGVQTATEIMTAHLAGLNLLKFYPSEPAGGIEVLRDFSSIFPDMNFMPSGKITLEKLGDYAALPSVASVGGTWMFSRDGRQLEHAEIVQRMRRSLDVLGARGRDVATA